ncbi:Os02g0135500 [Oryza sativa Japonica Group]|uniref:Os02g0135500 protein n=1 Tax=Oryza sativa subsp. japonica TaxID=39947 RepID=A0A0N7KEM8_ORYSJ|nr:hypothetical protein EE612_008713 [Oryza sativa]BAS76857.1 Os02g0135500 [Oryza sativa Japonica Group]
MKQSMRSRQEPRRVSNGVIIAAMLLSLCVLSIVKARYCSTPFVKPDDQLQEQMNSSIRMETDEPATMAAGGSSSPSLALRIVCDLCSTSAFLNLQSKRRTRRRRALAVAALSLRSAPPLPSWSPPQPAAAAARGSRPAA